MEGSQEHHQPTQPGESEWQQSFSSFRGTQLVSIPGNSATDLFPEHFANSLEEGDSEQFWERGWSPEERNTPREQATPIPEDKSLPSLERREST
eukprot:9359922-Heterocapsa_arctica.AAC.1